MTANNEKIEIYTLLFAVVSVFLILACFIVYFVLLYKRKQQKTALEKEAMKLHYEAELLKTHIEVQEQTMQTIAADLHDNIGQLLSLTTLTLGSIDLQQQKKAEKKIGDSLSLVNKSIQELRELAKLLHGEQVITLGLGHALQQEFYWLKKTEAYQLKFNNQLIDLKITSPDKDLIILRLLQEIFNNIIKHAQASQIEINAHIANETLYLSVKEDGIGFDYETIKDEKLGMGLSSLQKRVAMINGVITINSAPQQGTSITIEIPYP